MHTRFEEPIRALTNRRLKIGKDWFKLVGAIVDGGELRSLDEFEWIALINFASDAELKALPEELFDALAAEAMRRRDAARDVA